MEKILNILRNDRIAGALGALSVLIICLPYIILGEDAVITIHDNLDGAIANLKLLKDNHLFFDSDSILPIMSGIRRCSLGNEWNLILVPFVILPCYWAVVVNIVMYKLTAYIGLYLLLRQHLTKTSHPLVSMLVALAFACVPAHYATVCGISSAGIPLLVYAFLNLCEKQHLALSYALIVYYALGSFLVLSGVFVCFGLFFYGIYLLYAKYQESKHYIIGFALLCAVYIGTNYSMFISHFVDSGYVSHRTEFMPETYAGLSSVLHDGWHCILHSQYHAGSFGAWFILQMFIASFMLGQTRLMRWCAGFWGLLVSFIIIAKFLPYIGSDIGILKQFQFDRFYFLYPALCFVMLGLAMANVYDQINNRKVSTTIILIVCGGIMLSHLFFDAEIRSNWRYMLSEYQRTTPSFKQFYAEDVFGKICDDLQIEDRTSTKVVSIAMFPAVAEYNGFYCLDGYFSDYPLTYKHHFRKIIDKELENDVDLKNYFDAWGSRCYMFSSELWNMNNRYLIGKQDKIAISPKYDVARLRELGCQYIFSATEYKNYVDYGLKYEGTFTNDASYWQIFVYKL